MKKFKHLFSFLVLILIAFSVQGQFIINSFRFGDGVFWNVETIDDGGGDNVGSYNDIAIDSFNNRHIVYQDSTNDDLQYNLNIGGVWSQADVGNNNYSYSYICETTDPRHPIISIQGQSIANNVGDAETNALLGLSLLANEGLPFAELKVMYIVILGATNQNEKILIYETLDVRDNAGNIIN